ncbi:MAG: CBS domain-containing protein [Deltaproteobacteria bacterium]|nr:CBS domain-containing protein [Deltaproteobacteria bacterium]
MIARDLITDSLTPLKTSDSGALALGMMDEYRVSHMPIVNNKEFLGVISDTDIFNLNAFDDPLGNHNLSLNGAYVKENQPVYEVIQTFANLKLTIMAVVDEKNQYLGAITLANLVHHMANITSIDTQGGIIVLEINDKDYSLSQICQIVEYNDATVLSSYITSFPDSTKLEVTLKINRLDIGSILQTFDRYGYHVISSYSNKDAYSETIQERFDSLMNYLNI